MKIKKVNTDQQHNMEGNRIGDHNIEDSGNSECDTSQMALDAFCGREEQSYDTFMESFIHLTHGKISCLFCQCFIMLGLSVSRYILGRL